MEDWEVEEHGEGAGSGQLISAASTASVASSSRLNSLDPGPQSMIVDQRKSNAIIEKSNFPGATVAPTLEKQKNISYNSCTFICGGQSSHHGSFNSQPSNESGLSSRRDSLVLGEDSARRMYDCRLPDSQVSFSSVGEGASSSPDYTRVSDKIYFYNVKPLRPGTRIYGGKQKHAVDIFQDVAVKLVPYQNLQEIKILLELAEHMNVVNIVDSGVMFGHVREIYIAMELCSQNLREYVCENENIPVNFERNASYSKQLMTGLDFIHSNNIIHTDLKPDNILFCQSKKIIKISDFGMSKYLNHDISMNKTPSVVGADGFRAPELYCTPPKVSKSSDVFSMGVIIFYMLTNGKHPFGDSPHDWSYHIRHYKHQDLTPLNYLHALPYKRSQLLNIISAILHKVADARPPTQEILGSPFYEGVACRVEEDVSCETQPKFLRRLSTGVTELQHPKTSSMYDNRCSAESSDCVEPIACDSPADCSSPDMADPIDEVPHSSNQAPFSQPRTSLQGIGLFSPSSSFSTELKVFDVKSPFQGWLKHTDLMSSPISVLSSVGSPLPRQPCSPIILSDDSRPATAHTVGSVTQVMVKQQPPSPIWISSDEDEGIEE